MKTKVIKISILLLLIIPSSKAQDVYLDKIDSLLKTMGKLILNDLSKDSIKVTERPRIWFGEAFELEVIFDAKRSFIITSLNRPEATKKKTSKWHLKRDFYFDMFMDYINEHNELPYNTFDSFTYKFLLAPKKGETFGDALFGDYRFKAKQEGLSIIDKKIVILKGENAILEKHNSVW